MTHNERARADKRTTERWLQGEPFTVDLARLDLEVWAADGLMSTTTIQGLADRWRWSAGAVVGLCRGLDRRLWPADLAGCL